MELMRGTMGLDPESYRTDARLMEMSFGRWEGFTYADLQTREAEALAARERDKWDFVLPGGESYAQLEKRVQVWYESIARATVASAHGGVCRASAPSSRGRGRAGSTRSRSPVPEDCPSREARASALRSAPLVSGRAH